jgi:putative ABC transport system ATP-binding protein
VSAAPLIELRDVSRLYGDGDSLVRALDHANLSIEEGEMVAVMGASGSGKSTCLNVLGCLDQPTSGAYLFKGIDISRLDDTELALFRRKYLGFVFQSFNLLARTSAQENVELPLVYRRIAAAERRARARRALHEVGLEGREHHTPAELSGGQQQRVAIARAIVTDPAMILADEPTGNLDSAKKAEIMALFTKLNQERGITVIIVSHEPDMAEWARRVVVFRDGAVAEDRRRA